jgi:hypothetical protein
MIHNEEIRKELEEIAPYLAQQDLRLGFKVPKGYFEELPEMVLESVSPLAELKQSTFKVPANYFESLPDLVLERVAPKPVQETAPEPVRTPQRSWMDELFDNIAAFFQPRYALRLAGIAVLIIGGFFLLQNNFNNNGEVILAEAEQNPLQEYGISLDDLTDEDLALLLADAPGEVSGNASNPTLDELLNTIDIDDLTDEDLEEFM